MSSLGDHEGIAAISCSAPSFIIVFAAASASIIIFHKRTRHILSLPAKNFFILIEPFAK
jgi:hypothetical protein